MPDATSTDNSSIDSMLTGFFANISQRAFGRAGADSGQRAFGQMRKNLNGIESKFKQLQNVAQSSYETMRAGTNRAIDATESLNKKLREQAERIRKMPKLPRPTAGQPHPTTGQGRDPETGRWLPGRGGRGGGGSGTRFGSRFSPGGGLGGISAFGGLGSVGALFAGASVARGFSSFDANLATLQAEAGLNQAQRKNVTGQILDIAGSTQFDTQQVSSTLIAMVKDGIELKDALEQVPNVLKLAVAESTDLESAWSAMRGFVQSTNSEWSDSVRLSDMMSNATSLSAAKLSDLQDIASRGLTAHSSLDAFSTEGFLAISGILKSLNISNEVIGTGMRQFGTTIARATEGGLDPKAMAQLQARGIQFERGMTEVEALKELQAGVEGMQDTELKNFFHDVFGERAKKVFENVIPKVDELAEKMEMIRKKGTVNEKFEVHAKSLTNQMKLLTSAGDSLIKKFVMILNEGEAFGGGIGWVTEKITQLTAFMESNKDGIQEWWANFQEILGGLFGLLETGIEKFANFWGGLNEGQKTILAIGGIILTFLANPVAGVIAAGALIIAKWQPIKSFFIGLWNDITWETAEAWDTITGKTASAWEKVKGFFSGVKEFFVGVWNAITNPVKSAVDFIKGAWDKIKEIFSWEPFQVISEAFAPVKDFFSGLADTLKAPLETTFNWIKAQFAWLKNEVIDLLNWLPGVNIGGTAEKTSALPQIARLEGETDQMYKFRQMQERDRLRKLEAGEVLSLRTIEEEDDKLFQERFSAIKRQRRLRAGTTALGGFEKYEQFTEMMNAPPSPDAQKSLGTSAASATQKAGEFYETQADTSATPIVEMKVPEHLRPGRAFNRNFLPNMSRVVEMILQHQKNQMRQGMMAGRGVNRTSMPYLPGITGFGDELVKQILGQEDIQLFVEMMAADRRRKAPESAPLSGTQSFAERLAADKRKVPDALFETEKRQLPTVDPFSRFDGREATRVISFPKLDDAQYTEMSGMFRDGFLSLVDVSSAILSEMQTQTRLMGGTPDTLTPVIRPLSDSVVDDMVANRLQMTQEMPQPELKDIAAPHVPVIDPQIDSTLDRLLERLRLSEGGEREHGRVTPTGQRVEVEGRSTSGQGNITIEKIEINAGSEKSAREIAQAVLAELERERRTRNF